MNASENPFYEIMSEHSNEKLLDIVENKRNEYEVDAISAAESVLKLRNISWTIKSEETEPIQFENVREEINYRLENGETIEMIRNDLKSRGVNVFEYAEMDQEEEAKNNPDFAYNRNKLGLRISAVVMMLYALLRASQRNSDDGIFFVIILFVVLVLLVLSFLVKSGKK
jgi:hypothetical protein